MTSYFMIPILFLYLILIGIGTDAIYFNPEEMQLITDALKGSVTEDKNLPEEFYGSWAVTGTAVKTSNPEKFKSRSTDLWIFSKTGDTITLTNPITKASASITVKEVQGNTATFTRESVTDKLKEHETATITVDGDKFHGKDSITVENSDGNKTGVDSVEYDVQGRKIAGTRLEELFSK